MNSAGGQSISEAAREFIGKRHQRVLRDGRAIGPDSPDEALHKLRIECKRLRYLLEFATPVFGSLDRFVKQLKKLQDVLGDFQDACVATQQLRRYADTVPMRKKNRQHLLALGQLISSQRRDAIERRASFKSCWKRFDVKGRRKEVLELLR